MADLWRRLSSSNGSADMQSACSMRAARSHPAALVAICSICSPVSPIADRPAVLQSRAYDSAGEAKIVSFFGVPPTRGLEGQIRPLFLILLISLTRAVLLNYGRRH